MIGNMSTETVSSEIFTVEVLLGFDADAQQ